MKTPSIKNIIFDLGNVLLDIDFHRLKPAFEKLGIEHFDQQYSIMHASDIFVQIEKGQLTPREFFDEIRRQSSSALTDEQLADAFCSMLIGFRLESLDFIRQLTSHYRIFLLSNSNAIHLQKIQSLYLLSTGSQNLHALFEKAYFSHEIGMRKPETDVYSFVLQDAGIEAEETLFIDDVLENIKPAQSAGWKTHLLLKDERVENLPYWCKVD
jgi:FMN phosphatase YigB (HAD superfamily)